MDEIIYKLPKGIELSQYLKEKAIAYLSIMLGGNRFYIPITKEMKKQYHLIERKGKLIPTNYTEFERLCKLCSYVMDSVYLQMRDNVCVGIEQSLHQDLQHGFSKLFEKFIGNKVKENVNLRLEKK